MKINFVSFSDFESEIKVFNLSKMDLFVFLLVEILKRDSDKTIKEVLLELDVTVSLLYLYQNNFYYLLDNKLIINSSDSEDIGEVKVNQVELSDFGRLCLEEKSVIELVETKNKRVIYDPFKRKLVSDNLIIDSNNLVVIDDDFNYLELINKYKKEILNRYDDNFVLNYSGKEANPYYFSMDVNSEDIDRYLKPYLKKNRLILGDNKLLNEKNKEFLSSNFKVNIFYGKEENLVDCNYCFLVNEEKKYKIEGNKIYVEEIVEELSKYSFVDVSKFGYNVGKINVDNEFYSVFEKEKIKDYSSDIKKYLMRNKEKFSDLKLIDKVIDLL